MRVVKQPRHCGTSVHEWVARRFAGFGAFSARHSTFHLSIGLIVLLIWSLGIKIYTTQTDVTELIWRTGDQLSANRDTYDSLFGGLPRLQSIIISGPNLLSVDGLNCVKNQLTPLTVESETGVPLSTEVTAESFIGGSGNVPKTYTAKDFCDAPLVPDIYQSLSDPTSPSGLAVNVAYAYQQLTLCINGSATLPSGWGITRFPCQRYSVLDCFAEGNFDYPLALQQLDAVATQVKNSAKLTSCLTTVQNALVSQQNVSPTQAATVMAQTSTAVSLFASWGYTNRFSFSSSTSAAIASYMASAQANTVNPSVTSAQCVSGSLPCCATWNGKKLPTSLIFNQDFTAYRTVLQDLNEDDPLYVTLSQQALSANRLALHMAWEQAIIDYLQPKYARDVNSGFESTGPYSTLSLDFFTARSFDDNLTAALFPDLWIIVVGHVIVMVYSCLVLSKWSFPYTAVNAVYSRLMVAFAGVAVTALATTAGFGFSALCGISYNYVSLNLVPLLGLLFGMQNVFFVVEALLSYASEKDVPTRLKRTWATAGPSVFLISLIQVVVFLVAAAYPVPVTRAFCFQMAITCAFNFFSLLLVYTPILALDSYRTLNLLTDCCVPPCIPVGKVEYDESSPQVRETGRYIGRFIREYSKHILINPFVKSFVLVAFAAFLVVFAWNGFVNATEGLPVADVLTLRNYAHDYLLRVDSTSLNGVLNTVAFAATMLPAGQSLATNQAQVLTAQADIGTTAYSATSPLPADWSWFGGNGMSLLAAESTSSTTPITPATDNNFNTHLGDFLNVQYGAMWTSSLSCRDRTTLDAVACTTFNGNLDEVAGARIPLFTTGVLSTAEVLAAIKAERKEMDYRNEQGAGSFVYGEMFGIFQHLLGIRDEMYGYVGYNMIVVGGLLLLLQFSWVATLITAVVILSGVVELYGLCSLINVDVNAFTLINLSAFTLAMMVSFTVHLVHIFLMKVGSDRNQRMTLAMEEILPAAIHSYATSFLCLVCISASSIPFLTHYYWGMFCLMAFVALVNGTLLLPVLLSLIGPASYYEDTPPDQDSATELVAHRNPEEDGGN